MAVIYAKQEPYVIDARGKILGRVATEAVRVLTGKNNPSYEPNALPCQKVIVLYAEKISVSGGKEHKKIYTRFSGYPGGLKHIAYNRLFEKNPAVIVEHAVRGMLPKNKLRSIMMRNLKIFKGDLDNKNTSAKSK